MSVRSALALGAVAMAAAPIAAGAASRSAAPVEGANALGGGQGSLYFLAGIAFVAAAIVLLPEDQPASP